MALGATPEIALAIVAHGRQTGVRLDIALMRGGRCEAALDDEICLCKTCLNVTVAILAAREHVLAIACGDAFLLATFVENGGAFFHGLVDIDHMRQHVILDLDRLQSGAGDRAGGCGDGGDCVAIVKGLFACHDIVEHIACALVFWCVGEIRTGDHGFDPSHGLRG